MGGGGELRSGGREGDMGLYVMGVILIGLERMILGYGGYGVIDIDILDICREWGLYGCWSWKWMEEGLRLGMGKGWRREGMGIG